MGAKKQSLDFKNDLLVEYLDRYSLDEIEV